MAMNRVFRTLLLLSYLCASICALRFSIRPRINRPRAPQTTPTPTAQVTAIGSCRKSNWWSSFDKIGWSECPATFPYINGLYRSRASQANRDWIYLLEEANCCGDGNSNAECMRANWVASFDRNRNWNLCPSGYYLSGLYRSAGHNLRNIEYAWCCKPPGAPNSYKSCYNENVWSRFDWNRKGMVSCTKSGYYITGLYRSSCNFMYCIEEFKCCQLPAAKAPQTTPTPTAQVTTPQTTPTPTAQVTTIGSCRKSNWWSSFDKIGWSECPATFPYINGLYRSRASQANRDWIYLLEEANCCGDGNSNAECVRANWVASFDRNRNWNLCPSGYYLSGLYRSAGHNLRNIEYAWCCKPPGAPNSYKSCYNENVWSRFDWNRKGMVSCTKSGYYITGLYRSSCNFMYCIEEFKCCQLPAAKAPQTTPTPTAQVTTPQTTPTPTAQVTTPQTTPTPTAQVTTIGSCRNANWWASFDKTGWSKCPATFPYINGLYRSRASQANRDWIYLLEEAKCCGNGNSNAECVQANWVASFDRNRNWNLCPSGYYLSGLHRSAGHNLHNIEYAWCCKPPGAPNSYKSCYNENVWSRFDWNRKDMVSCTRSGYYITGLYRSSCNFMHCIEEFKCCQLQAAKSPQTTPTPTAQVTTPQTTPTPTAQVTSTTPSNWFQIQSAGYNKCLTASYVTRRGVYRKPFNGKTQTYRYFLTTKVALYLSDCANLSNKQSWRWTSGGRLQSNLTRQCLTVTSVWNGYLGKRYGASLQPCNSSTSSQGWVCNGGYLKLKNKNLYLVPFIYSGRQRPSGGVTVRSSVTNSCLWTRYDTSKSLCANAPQTTPTPTAQVTTVTAQNPWFQIKNTAYKKCLALRDKSQLSYGFKRLAATFTLDTCDQNSARQLLQWTSDGQLKLNHNGNCLTYDWFKGIHFQPCTASNRNQQWLCVGNKLKLRFNRQYLVTFMYSGLPFGYNVKTMWYCAYANCAWSRFGTGLSVCDNAPQTTPTPTAQVTTVTAQNPWFRIKNTAYKKCIALRDKSQLSYGFKRLAATFTLDTCDQNSARQLWQWTSDGQLKLNHNGNCLTYDWFKGIHFQPCTASNRNQQWLCVGNKLKLRFNRQYLVTFMYSGLPFGYNVKTMWYCAYGSCAWSRFGTGLSVCDNGKATTTRDPMTTQIISTEMSTTIVATTNTPTTKTIPSTTQPPVPPTDDIGTPPLPPTGTLIPPPIPANTPPVPPLPGNTPPVVTTTKPPPPQGNKKIRCGTKGRIGGVVNGTRAATGSWPWQVGIKKCAYCNITCGGTLINDEWVVTAAHCVSGWFPDELYIVIGEVDQSTKSGHEQRFRCRKIIVHEDYGIDAPYDKDIALIRLDKYAVYNDNVRPLCLPGSGTVLTEKDLCTVTGFGRVAQNGVKSARLLQANVKIVPFNTCVKSYASLLNPRKVTSNMFCAGYKRGGTDACQGDSGGPLTCFDRSNSRFILGGVVSWGVGCAQPDLYGVYTNTALFTPWVQKKLAAFGY